MKKKVLRYILVFGLLLSASISAYAGKLEKALCDAASQGDADKVRSLLLQGVSANHSSTDSWRKGKTPLYFSVESPDTEVLEILLAVEGIELNTQECLGSRTPLSYAVELGNIEAMRLLIDTGADLEVRSSMQRTPLALAVDNENAQAVQLLVDAGADVNVLLGGVSERDEYTLLAFAVKKGNLEIIQLILDSDRVEVDQAGRSKYSKTPLWSALWNGGEILRMLLAAGADPDQYECRRDQFGPYRTNYYRNRAIDQVIQLGSAATLRILLEGGANPNPTHDTAFSFPSPLYRAADAGDLDKVEVLLEHGVNPNRRGDSTSGETPLCAAVRKGHLEVVRAFLANEKTDMNHCGQSGRPALSYAGSDAMVRLLLEHGANPNWTDGKYHTLLHDAIDEIRHATAKDDDDAKTSKWKGPRKAAMLAKLKLLFEFGADPHQKSAMGRTVWFDVILYGNTELVRYLLDRFQYEEGQRRIDINELSEGSSCGDQAGTSALLYAVMYSHEDLIDLLLERGADVNASGPEGWLPLHRAAMQGEASLVQRLLDLGAQKDALAGNSFSTPLSCAVKSESIETAQVLIAAGAGMDLEIQGEADERPNVTDLYYQLFSCNLDMLRLFIASGLDGSKHIRGLVGCCYWGGDSTKRNIERLKILLIGVRTPEGRLSDGRSLLLYATQERAVPVEIVQLLVAHGAKFTSKELYCFHNVVSSRSVELLRALLPAVVQASQLEDTGWRGLSPLGLAVYEGNPEKVNVLLEAGANPNIEVGDAGATLLFVALLNEQKHEEAIVVSIIRALVAAGAEVNKRFFDEPDGKNNEGLIPQEVWTRYLQREIAESRTSEAVGYPCLYFAVLFGNETLVRVLVDARADILARAEDGYTAAELAEVTGQEKMAQYLRNCELEQAVLLGDANALGVALRAGAEVDAPDAKGYSPLHVAASFGNADIVELLYQNGANLNFPEPGGAVALHFAALEGFAEVVRTLISCGADVNVYGENRTTPLHDAVAGGHADVVQELLNSGANAFLENSNGETPLALAELMSHQEVVDVLRGVERPVVLEPWEVAIAGGEPLTLTHPSHDDAQPGGAAFHRSELD